MNLNNNFQYLYRLGEYIESRYPSNSTELFYLYDRQYLLVESNNITIEFCMSLNTFYLNYGISANRRSSIKLILERISSLDYLLEIHAQFNKLPDDLTLPAITGEITPRTKFCSEIVGMYNSQLLRTLLSNINEFIIIYNDISDFTNKMFINKI